MPLPSCIRIGASIVCSGDRGQTSSVNGWDVPIKIDQFTPALGALISRQGADSLQLVTPAGFPELVCTTIPLHHSLANVVHTVKASGWQFIRILMPAHLPLQSLNCMMQQD